MALTPEQQERYDRNRRIAGIGNAGQERLLRARVCVVGLGGLGSAAAYYLAAAGVGVLGLVDSDLVELSNLQRQVLHEVGTLGWPKSVSAARALAALNPDIHLEPRQVRLTEDNAPEILSLFDIVVEATDNFEAKLLLNDACLTLRKPLATAGILGLSGHAMLVVPGRTPCLRCVVPDVPEDPPTTAAFGVLGSVPGVLGSLEAMEVIRWIAGLWKRPGDGRGSLHSLEGETMRLRTMRIPRRTDCRCASLWSS